MANYDLTFAVEIREALQAAQDQAMQAYLVCIDTATLARAMGLLSLEADPASAEAPFTGKSIGQVTLAACGLDEAPTATPYAVAFVGWRGIGTEPSKEADAWRKNATIVLATGG